MPVMGALILSLLLVWAFTRSWELSRVQLDSLHHLPCCCLCPWTLKGIKSQCGGVEIVVAKLWVFLRDKNAVLSLFKDKLTTLFWGQAGSDQHRGACCRYWGLEGWQQLLGLCLCGAVRFVLGPWSSGNRAPVRCTSGNVGTKGLKCDQLWHSFHRTKYFYWDFGQFEALPLTLCLVNIPPLQEWGILSSHHGSAW